MGRTYKVGEGVAVLFAADDVGELLGIGHWRDMLGAGEGFDYRRRLFQSIASIYVSLQWSNWNSMSTESKFPPL